jgi:predicted TPR repeat methyltransferase
LGKEHALQFIDQHQEKMDVIIGSDLLYVASEIKPLFETVLVLLKPKSGKFLMAHC